MNIKSVKKMVMPEDGITESNTLKVIDTNEQTYNKIYLQRWS